MYLYIKYVGMLECPREQAGKSLEDAVAPLKKFGQELSFLEDWFVKRFFGHFGHATFVG